VPPEWHSSMMRPRTHSARCSMQFATGSNMQRYSAPAANRRGGVTLTRAVLEYDPVTDVGAVGDQREVGLALEPPARCAESAAGEEPAAERTEGWTTRVVDEAVVGAGFGRARSAAEGSPIPSRDTGIDHRAGRGGKCQCCRRMRCIGHLGVPSADWRRLHAGDDEVSRPRRH